VKDVEDIKGDLVHGLQTLPVKIGLRSTKKFLVAAYVILLIHLPAPALFYYFWAELWVYNYLILALALLVPVWGLCVKSLIFAVKPVDYKRQSRLLKLMMALGLLILFTLPI
jgi:4-hydroxybenzoate polyprenyltransferase